MYKEVSKKSFPKIEEEIINFWEKNNILSKSIENSKIDKDFVFYDGPPGTNGTPHIGHMLQSTLKDLFPRYKSMQGYKVIRKAGWDTHGLPIELTAQKELGLSSKKDIEEYGLLKFIDYCRETVFRYKKEWVFAIKRIGRMLDFEDEYATLTNDFIQSDWWVLKKAWEKQLLYKGYKVLAYCPRLGTSLSNQEVSLGYKEVTDISIYAKFPVKNEENTYFIAWTTTPWTLIGNVALALGPDIDYVKIKTNNEYYILARERIEALKEKGFLKDFDIKEEYKGSELANKEYTPLWDFFSSEKERQHYTTADDYVTTEDGSGIVHLALYGEDDYRLINKYKLPFIQHVNEEGKFVKQCGIYKDRMFDEEGLDIAILKDLLDKNLVFAKEKLLHNYPFNYKTNTRLLYFAKSSWFLKTTDYKDNMIEANKDINWYPAHIKEGRFGKWLSSNIDWAISRDRFWGSPLPIWTCEKCNHQIVVASIGELNQYTKEKITNDFDLHIPKIDKVICSCPECSADMYREKAVLDCWFNSGVMPWGQLGYPAKKHSDKLLEELYPADFICEGIDQTRGWFYALLALSTMINDGSSYKNVICTELVLDEHGNKMSKTKGNIVDPINIFNKYGADAMRWLFINIKPGSPIRFSESNIKDHIREIILPLWNIYSFFITYAKIDNYEQSYGAEPKELQNPLDIWIISELKGLITEITNALDNYDPSVAANYINKYIDKLSNWYIRRSRRRFWKSENDNDKIKAYDCLHYVLLNLVKLLAPFIPFITEEIYQNIERSVNKNAPISVHLCNYPKAKENERNKNIEYEMNLIRNIVSIARFLRNKHGLKIRQPLSSMIIISSGKEKDKEIILEMQSQIKEELNIKEILFEENENSLVDLIAKPNLRMLGRRFGKELKNILPLIEKLASEEIERFIKNKELTLKCNGGANTLSEEELIIEKQARKGLIIERSEEITIALNSKLNDELISEGIAREFINKVQNMRKEEKLNVLDRIKIDYYSNDNIVEKSIDTFQKYIGNETLAKTINFKDNMKNNVKNWSLNGRVTDIYIEKL